MADPRRVLETIARQKALATPLGPGGGCSIYGIGPGWELEALKRDASVRQVRGSVALEQALGDPDSVTILLVSKSALTLDLVEAVCARSAAVGKTIIWELTEGERIELKG